MVSVVTHLCDAIQSLLLKVSLSASNRMFFIEILTILWENIQFLRMEIFKFILFVCSARPVKDEIVNPCIPSPCGNFAQCNDVRGSAVCHCLPNYHGSPPHCRPECTVNSDCSNTKSCANERCIDPCPGSCGMDSVCNVINHVPNCACKPGYEGDAFVRCHPIVVAARPSKKCVPIR